MIIKLPENISNQIAAGEVVERPASVVKELVENSIDAGATKIIVEIVSAGKDLIKVSDNGKGVADEDIDLLFERHATSKIQKLEDIYNIYSLGFRGEALASISSVSKVLLVSKTESDSTAKKVIYYDGEIKSIERVAGTTGTTISVSDIFYNTPVRYKFLETNTREKSKILSLMTKLSLSRPDISFTMVVDGKEQFRTDGKGKLFNALHLIYGTELTSKIVEVNLDNDRIKLSGFISLPEYTRGNKAMQVIFVNGRYVESKELSKAITNAYDGLLMLHRHPAYFLNIELPSDAVDVNIHPQKIELKFENFSAISVKVHNLVKNSLYKYNQTRKVDMEKMTTFKKEFADEARVSETISKIKEVSQKNNADRDFYIPQDDKIDDIVVDPVFDELFASEESLADDRAVVSVVENDSATITGFTEQTGFDEEILVFDDIVESDVTLIGQADVDELEKARRGEADNKDFDYNLVDKDYLNAIIETKKSVIEQSFEADDIADEEIIEIVEEESIEYVEPELLDRTMYDDLTVLGQLFSTFITAEKEDKAYFIDQHAAHERVMYEKFLEDFRSKRVPSQYLMEPYTYNFKYEDVDIIDNALEFLKSLDLDIEIIDDKTVEIKSVPVFDSPMSIDDLCYMLDSFKEKNEKSYEKLLLPSITMKACKAAVKANDVLTADEMSTLISSLKTSKNPNTCPHGRPVMFEITKKEFEKLFKRIV